MSEITIGSDAYRIGRLSTFDQYHAARKLAPVLLFVSGVQNREEVAGETFAKAILSITSSLSKQDSELALNLCLSVIKRKQGPAWAAIMEPSSGRLAFEDIDVKTMLLLVWEVLKEHRLLSFFDDAPSSSPEEAKSS